MDASSFRTILEQLHPKCSTALTIPHVNASLLKNVKVPRLNITRFVSPGFFCQAKDILDHISRNPFQMKYYVDHVLDNLKQTERTIYDNLIAGKRPETVKEILQNIASTHLPPAKLELMSIEEIVKNGRIHHPTDSKNILSSTKLQIKRRLKLQSILLNVIQMFKFYE